MNAETRVRWLNARDPLHKWKVGQDIYCLHCEAVFKAEDVAETHDDYPECPRCDATPIDFFPMPFWRDDLVDEKVVRDKFVHTWRVKPIQATAGRPIVLPSRNDN